MIDELQEWWMALPLLVRIALSPLVAVLATLAFVAFALFMLTLGPVLYGLQEIVNWGKNDGYY